ncbi:MAG TPA: hypothetical protein PKD26_04565 [Pyrinomonadaceae bacterium]|mgnify:CR=1 FL=1|nr:hypothetical protein [Pyrinomonadaceae bacterium]
MKLMIIISLVLNIAVLIPVCYGLLTDDAWVRESYGDATAARGILLSVYISIALVSFSLLVRTEPKFVAALLLVQIIYKIITPFAVGTVYDPVVVSNLLIALFHSFTLFFIYRDNS